jgi:palmitoyltransferase
MCGACVKKFDHHCPWINNCVGFQDQRYFFLFLVYLWLGSFYCGMLTFLAHRRALADGDAALRAAASGMVVVFVEILCAAIWVAMCGFVGWSLYLLVTNQTPVEVMINKDEAALAQKRGLSFRNPYDLGPWRNVTGVFTTLPDAAWATMLCRRSKQRVVGTLTMVRAVLWMTLPTLAPLGTDGRQFSRWYDAAEDVGATSPHEEI